MQYAVVVDNQIFSGIGTNTKWRMLYLDATSLDAFQKVESF